MMVVSLTQPLSLVKLSCLLGAKSTVVVLQTWMELLRAAFSFHLNMLWRLLIWAIAIFSLPVRALTALQRERLLELHLQGIQAELEDVVCDRKQLEWQLQRAVKERKMLELMLAELEDEHDEAIIKLELLEGEVEVLKVENQRLNEIQGKAFWSYRAHDDAGDSRDMKDGNMHPIPLCKPSSDGNRNISRQVAQGDDWKNTDSKPEVHDIANAGSIVDIGPYKPAIISNFDISEASIALEQRKELAFSRSLFSAILSILVGMIAWEADDPCMPLVVALFIVVGMSLRSVVLFFYTIKNRPASHAVALLSFNWFILGMLTYPMLPMVSRLLSSLFECTFRWLGFSLLLL